MRRLFLRLEVLAVVIVAVCLAVLSGAQKPARADLELASGPGGSLTLSNDKEGTAILTLDKMRPGDTVTDTVTLGNTGTLDGDLSLSTSNLVDTPGGGGGALSGKLDLRIRDVTVAGSPMTVYDGKIDALTPFALGTLTAGVSRVYEFRVSFPDAGPGAENSYQGSTMSVQFDWTASTVDVDPPETTITSGPAGLSASPDATVTFTADEAGSTFECSLDGVPFASCTSPATFTGLADGAHTFDVRATDSSTNTDPTPDRASWTIDATPPSVSLADPGSPLRGTVTLSPSADDGTGSGIASLVVQRSPAGAGIWTTIATSWNTTGVADGGYDLRAHATDNAGNPADSPIRTVTVDNKAPALVSSSPADGEFVTTASSFTIVADENLAGIMGAEIDGAPAPAPVLAGPTATYTSVFADGVHTFNGQLADAAGNTRPILIHFTVDGQIPTKPGKFAGANQNGRLVLKWTAATDNSGAIGAYLVYANGSLMKTLSGSDRSADIERFQTTDGRAFQVAARDAAGNVSPKTRALVIVPRVTKLMLATAQAKLTSRGLRAGAVRYAYSSTIAAGRVISARSGVAPKGTAIGLTVSRGPAGRSTSNLPSTGSGFSSGSDGPTYPGPSYNGGVPTPGSTSGGTSGGTPVTPATGSAGPETSDGSGEVQPESFSPSDDSSSTFPRLLGLALLGGAFAAAGAIALRARRPRVPRSAGTVEPLMFWDQRLMHAVSTSVRRVTGRL
jgi:hypothetical protein